MKTNKFLILFALCLCASVATPSYGATLPFQYTRITALGTNDELIVNQWTGTGSNFNTRKILGQDAARALATNSTFAAFFTNLIGSLTALATNATTHYIYHYISTTLGTNAGDWTQLGTVTNPNSAVVEMEIITDTSSGTGKAVQHYVIPRNYGEAASQWFECLPVYNARADGDFAVDIKLDASNTYTSYRVRRTAINTAVGQVVYIVLRVNSVSDSFIPLVSTGTGGTVPGGIYTHTPLTQKLGKVGINTNAPGYELDVQGAGSLSGNLIVVGTLNSGAANLSTVDVAGDATVFDDALIADQIGRGTVFPLADYHSTNQTGRVGIRLDTIRTNNFLEFFVGSPPVRVFYMDTNGFLYDRNGNLFSTNTGGLTPDPTQFGVAGGKFAITNGSVTTNFSSRNTLNIPAELDPLGANLMARLRFLSNDTVALTWRTLSKNGRHTMQLVNEVTETIAFEWVLGDSDANNWSMRFAGRTNIWDNLPGTGPFLAINGGSGSGSMRRDNLLTLVPSKSFSTADDVLEYNPQKLTTSTNLSFHTNNQHQTLTANAAYVFTQHFFGARFRLTLTNPASYTVGFNGGPSVTNTIVWLNGFPRGGSNGVYQFEFEQGFSNILANFVQTFYGTMGDTLVHDGTNFTAIGKGAAGSVLVPVTAYPGLMWTNLSAIKTWTNDYNAATFALTNVGKIHFDDDYRLDETDTGELSFYNPAGTSYGSFRAGAIDLTQGAQGGGLGTLNTSNAVVLGNISYLTTTLLGAGTANTNYTLHANFAHRFMGSSNVNVVAVMGYVTGRALYWSTTITNLSTRDWGIGFSAVTNEWVFSGVYGTNAPNTLTNGFALELAGRSIGTNTFVGYTYTRAVKP